MTHSATISLPEQMSISSYYIKSYNAIFTPIDSKFDIGTAIQPIEMDSFTELENLAVAAVYEESGEDDDTQDEKKGNNKNVAKTVLATRMKRQQK